MSTIFGEEHFFDKSMISIIEERGNAIDNFIYEEIAGVAKYELPMPKIIINREKVKKWLILCSQLENLEHSELIDMATKKKLADKDCEIQELKNLLSVERSIRAKDAAKRDMAVHDRERYKLRIDKLQEQLDLGKTEIKSLRNELRENINLNKLFVNLYKSILHNDSVEKFWKLLENYRAEVRAEIIKEMQEEQNG